MYRKGLTDHYNVIEISAFFSVIPVKGWTVHLICMLLLIINTQGGVTGVTPLVLIK